MSNRETDFDELGGGPEIDGELPSLPPAQDDVPTSPHHDIPPFAGSPVPGDAERFAALVGIMLDEKLSKQEARFSGALNEVTTNQRLIYETVTGLRGEVRSRLASHETELEELRAKLTGVEYEVAALKARISALEDDGR